MHRRGKWQDCASDVILMEPGAKFCPRLKWTTEHQNDVLKCYRVYTDQLIVLKTFRFKDVQELIPEWVINPIDLQN